MLRRLLVAVALNLVSLALLAPFALAQDEINGGEGLYGETNDLVVTNFGFIVIAFFPLLALVLTLVQMGLEKRKEARKAAEKARASRERWHGGW